MGIVVLGTVFVDIKGHPFNKYIPAGRNAGKVIEVHGGVGRNVAEDIANVELRPTFISLVDDSAAGEEVIRKLNDHKVNTKYIRKIPGGMGTWLAVFNEKGDVVASISQRPDLLPIADIIDDHGDEIFKDCDSIVLEFDMDIPILKKVFAYAEKYDKKIYGVISNMSIALERRDLLKKMDCFVCNEQEAGMLFSENFEHMKPAKLMDILASKILQANFPRMIVTMGSQGAVYADPDGNKGIVPPQKVQVKDTTGAGDSFCAGVAIGLTYGKTLKESCEIATRLAASVICTTDSVCPRFLPSEFNLDIKSED